MLKLLHSISNFSDKMGMRSPEDIKQQLSNLIEEAQPVFPNLASRLDEIQR